MSFAAQAQHDLFHLLHQPSVMSFIATAIGSQRAVPIRPTVHQAISGFASLNLKTASGNDDMHLLRLSENRLRINGVYPQ